MRRRSERRPRSLPGRGPTKGKICGSPAQEMRKISPSCLAGQAKGNICPVLGGLTQRRGAVGEASPAPLSGRRETPAGGWTATPMAGRCRNPGNGYTTRVHPPGFCPPDPCSLNMNTQGAADGAVHPRTFADRSPAAPVSAEVPPPPSVVSSGRKATPGSEFLRLQYPRVVNARNA